MLKSILKFVAQLLTNPELNKLNWDYIQHFFVEPDASVFAFRGVTPNEHVAISNILRQVAPAGTIKLTHDKKGRPILTVSRKSLEVISHGEGREQEKQL